MFLSGADIRQYIKFGGLKFDPVLNDDQFQQNGVDLILYDFNVIRSGVDVKFALGVSLEYVTMPNDLMAFVELRSTWGRSVMSMPPTVIDAGFRGQITLEIWDWQDVDIPVGQRFAHIVFGKLASPSDPYAGKYQGQLGITGPKE